MADKDELANQLEECAAKQDFERAFKLVRENQAELVKKLQPAGVWSALRKTTNDRLLLSFMDGVGSGGRKLDEVLVSLEKLISFSLGSRVLSKAWGLGTVKKVDSFYRRITVDFKTKRGHQFTYAAAVDMLVSAPEGHILVKRESDSAAVDVMLKEKPGDFIKEVLRSNGSSMTLVRLEDFCVANGFVKSVNWKSFWDRARAALKQDKCVVIPAKKTEPIQLKSTVEDYGDTWLTAFAAETDPKLILASVREFMSQEKAKSRAADESIRRKIGDRLLFAVTASRKTDDALYARLACLIVELGYAEPSAEAMRGYLWERRRYIKAAAALPAREVGALVRFLADGAEAKAKLYAAIPDLCFTAVSEVVSQFGKEPECRAAVGAYMKEPKAPATLTTLIVGRYEHFKDWEKLPPLITLLTHAIALGEGRQGGETLKMQNIVRRLFGDKVWLGKVFGWLQPAEQALFFERFQASIAWDPSTHHAIVVRMTKIVPDLEAHLVKAEKKREYARVTSPRSYALRKAEYLKLINEDMPANVKRIEFAKGFGDLSENAEYQYAKDEQRTLMQKQTLMQADLDSVKAGDFADATTDEVMPGVTVVFDANGSEKSWTILGEWDNDLEKGIISSKTRVAQNLLGKKVGESFELPGEDGRVDFATIKEIRPLDDEIRAWMQVPAGLQI